MRESRRPFNEEVAIPKFPTRDMSSCHHPTRTRVWRARCVHLLDVYFRRLGGKGWAGEAARSSSVPTQNLRDGLLGPVSTAEACGLSGPKFVIACSFNCYAALCGRRLITGNANKKQLNHRLALLAKLNSVCHLRVLKTDSVHFACVRDSLALESSSTQRCLT